MHNFAHAGSWHSKLKSELMDAHTKGLQDILFDNFARMNGLQFLSAYRHIDTSVVIDNFYVTHIPATPFDTDPPLIVDPDRIFTLSIAAQRFITVSGQPIEVGRRERAVQFLQLPQRDPLDAAEPFATLPFEERFGIFAPKGLNH